MKNSMFNVGQAIMNVYKFFDGRQDYTKVLLQADNSSHQLPSIMKEEHCTVSSELSGRYLCHFTLEKELM